MKANMKKIILWGSLVGCTSPFPLIAGSDNKQFTVTANVTGSCSILANNLGFGDYDPSSGTDTTATTNLTVTCTNNLAYTVGLNEGTGLGGTTTTRVMTGPTTIGGNNLLQYKLYQNVGHTTNWGNNLGVDTKNGTGTGSGQTLTVYGLIPNSQNVVTGSYSDTITATVTF